MNYLSWVNPLQGTDSVHDFSTGNTLPLVARPWALHHWTLQTGASPWAFNRHARRVWGIRLTHQPSPWMRDYANVLITPFTGPCTRQIDHQASAYRLEEAVVRPDYLRAEFLRYGVTVEMSPSERGAVFVFSSFTTEPLRVRFSFDDGHSLGWERGTRRFGGWSDNRFQGEQLQDFGLHFHGEFDSQPASFERTGDGGFFTFPGDTRRVELRLAASFVSRAQAIVSWQRELADRSLQEIQREGAEVWNALLGRMVASDDRPERMRTFYSCLYRALLFPRFLDEIDAAGRTIHYSPFDGQIGTGPLCTDNGFWDTYRTVYPLLALVYPDKLPRIMNGWLNASRQIGWAPKWPSPGVRDCMIGTHFDAVVADLALKGIGGWDVEEAFTYLWKSSTVPSEDEFHGRPGLELYEKLGYVPHDRRRHAVSCTLDYAYGDFCVAQVARRLGREREAGRLLRRAQNYRNVFDPSVGFMRPRLSSGAWVEPFREFEWGSAYIEGGPWQYAFNVPHDFDGLAGLHGGPAKLLQRLDRMLAAPPTFQAGSYGYEIHEMTEMAEMAVAGFGQYAHSNQPVHNYLFLYALCGEPAKTSHWVNRVADELYSADHFPGDEDNGEMSAWYLFASMGIYPFCPGRPDYVRFRGALSSVELRVPGARENLLLGSAHHDESAGRIVAHHDLLGAIARKEPAIA